MPKSRKFIDRKNAVTFHLVHRSQQDPLIADEKAPQHVLIPADINKQNKTSDPAKRKEEQRKYGIYFDDNYDYLQHLRDANQTTVDWEPSEQSDTQRTKLKLPSSVFASQVEEDVGLLNKAAPHSGPRLDLDPDIVAAMDDDFDFGDPENELQDNFMDLANAEDDNSTEINSYVDSDEISDENLSEDDELSSLTGPQHSFADEETKSRFTNYSMSSSVMRRNKQLTLLDDCFEQMFTSCYGETDIGPLECEEIEGHIAPDSEVMLQYVKKMEEEHKLNRPLLEPDSETRANGSEKLDEEYTDEEKEDLVPIDIPEVPKEHWDCESILSTYSNLYNRPKIISEPVVNRKIRVSGRTGIPVGVLDGTSKDSTKLTASALARHNIADDISLCNKDVAESLISTVSLLSIRPKDETPEERFERKRALREYRKERRMERKANTLAFKEEKKRQEKIIQNNKKNVQGLHIF